tara:strand:- start:148 stop:555 length:408 start_codon:yes stop_codon:yes gene_type:complete
MATEVLVNDGGAPARIIPYIAGSTISAGDPIQIATDGEVDACFTTSGSMLGVALTAATSGNIANVITGRGVVLNAKCSGSAAGDNIAIGTTLVPDARGFLVSGVAHDSYPAWGVAIALEAGSATAGLLKIQTGPF